jgi:adenylate kinase family enzyme
MRKRGWGKNQYLVDGFPRSQDNLDHFNKILGEQVDVKFVLFFECSFETMEKRIMERGKTSGRADDNAEALKKRFDTYNTSTKPIVEHFEKDGKLKKISAEKLVDEVFVETKKVLDSVKGVWTNKVIIITSR